MRFESAFELTFEFAFEFTKAVAAAQPVVWDVLADVSRWPDWTASMTSVRPTEPGPIGPGSVVRIKQPKLPPATWRVTEFEPGSSFTWVSRAPGVTTTAWHRLDPEGDRTRATVGISQHGPLGRPPS
jgi:hypothetical protein